MVRISRKEKEFKTTKQRQRPTTVVPEPVESKFPPEISYFVIDDQDRTRLVDPRHLWQPP
jgi:hypothetical protein